MGGLLRNAIGEWRSETEKGRSQQWALFQQILDRGQPELHPTGNFGTQCRACTSKLAHPKRAGSGCLYTAPTCHWLSAVPVGGLWYFGTSQALLACGVGEQRLSAARGSPQAKKCRFWQLEARLVCAEMVKARDMGKPSAAAIQLRPANFSSSVSRVPASSFPWLALVSLPAVLTFIMYSSDYSI